MPWQKPSRPGIRWLFFGALLPCAIAGAALFFSYLAEKRDELQASAAQTARAVVQAADKDLAGIIASLRILATSPHLETGDLAAFQRQAAQIAEADDLVDVIALIRPDGDLAMTNLRPLGTPLPKSSNPEQLRTVLEKWQPVISDFYVGAVTRKPYISVQLPVRLKGQPHSLMMAVPAFRLAQILQGIDLPPGWIAAIVDAKGTVIARSHRHEETVGRSASPDFVQRIARGESEGTAESRNLDGIPTFTAFKRSSLSNWTVIVGMPRGLLYSSTRWSLILAGAVTVAAILTALLLAYLFSRNIETSLQALEEVTRDGASGRELPRHSPREIAELARRFSEMQAARQEALAEQQRFQRALMLLNDSNTALLFAEEESELLNEICRIVIEKGGYALAWVGQAEDDEQRSVKPLAWAGQASAYLHEARISWNDDEHGRGPTGTAIRSGRTQVNRDFLGAPPPWSDAARRHGFRSGIALPLVLDGKCIGTLTIYAAEADAFGDEEVGLLGKLAGNLSFGIERLRTRRQLAAINQELQSFTYAASHDMRAPLQRIVAFSALLERKHGPELSDDARVMLGFVKDNANRIMLLVEDLLSHARIEEVALGTGPVALAEIVRSVLAERHKDCEECGAQIDVDVPDFLVAANPLGLTQVLRNLVDNALKYSAASTPPVIRIGAQSDGDSCRLWVRDNGIGFDMAYHDRIFEIFRRLHAYSEVPGSGVGLALVRKAMTRMGGRVWAESAPGEGATFYIELPLAARESERPAEEMAG